MSVLLFAAVLAAPPEPLRVGVATADVTPPVGYRMSGYFYDRASTGTRDPLLAKAVVLRQGEEAGALVFCDVIGLTRAVSDAAAARVERETGIPAAHVSICATHSHTGPLYHGVTRDRAHAAALAEEGEDPFEPVDYAALLTEGIVEAVAAADAAAAPATFAAGNAEETRLSFNRRFYMAAPTRGGGPVRFNPGQRNPDILRAAGPIDPDVGLLRFDRPGADGPFAALTVFALHLDTVPGPQKTLYSADFPGTLASELREQFGEDFRSLFGAGTCGDLNHIDVTRDDRRSDVEIGTLLAETVAAALPGLPAATPSLRVGRELVNVPLREISPERAAAAEAGLDRAGDRSRPFLKRVADYADTDIVRRSGGSAETGSGDLPLELPVHVFRLSKPTADGGGAAVVTLPGELFVDLGLAIKRRSPFATTLVIELANDSPDYLPTRRAFAEGGYEVVNSRIAPGGGEAAVDAAAALLEELAAAP